MIERDANSHDNNVNSGGGNSNSSSLGNHQKPASNISGPTTGVSAAGVDLSAATAAAAAAAAAAASQGGGVGPPVYNEETIHKVILVGDSGVGKTSLLVQFDQGKFQSGSFSATVGIGFTIMLIGDSGVGKTCLLVRFKDDTFLSCNFIATVGIDFKNKIVTIDNKKVKLQIWDTAGQERFRSVTHAYYRDAQALLLLYDVTNQSSFDNIRAWLSEIRQYAEEDVVIMLLGNKVDKPNRVITKEQGEKLAKQYEVSFMETSAKTGQNVELAFMAVARALISKQLSASSNQTGSKFNLSEYIESNKEQKGWCCGT